MTYKYARTAATLDPGYREVLARRLFVKSKREASGCIRFVGALTSGYGHLTVAGFQGCGQMKTHVLAWLLWRGDVPARMDVAHLCNNKSCINPDHLYLATRSRNHQDARRDGLQRGVLAHDDVAAIRVANGLQREIAARYGTSQQMVSRIKNGLAFRFFN